MEMAQLCKIHIIISCSNPLYLCHKRKMSQIGEHTLAEPKLKVTP